MQPCVLLLAYFEKVVINPIVPRRNPEHLSFGYYVHLCMHCLFIQEYALFCASESNPALNCQPSV